MEGNEQAKLSLKLIIPIAIVIILLIAILVVCIYKTQISENTNTDNVAQPITTGNKTENNVKEDEKIDNSEICIIKGENSNLLYKNEFESDTTYCEKIVFLDDEARDNMVSNNYVVDANQVLYIGKFAGEFIRVKYDSDLSDYSMSLLYMEDEEFYECTTNKIIKKAIDKNGKEVNVTEIDYDYDNKKITTPSNVSAIYALFDITNRDGEDYIIGMYDEVFSDDENVVVITVVLKKENAKIDIDNEKQVKSFWNRYANYEIEEVDNKNQVDYENVNIDGKTYYARMTTNTWNGAYHQDEYYTGEPNQKVEVVSYDDYIDYIDEINSNALESEEKIKSYYTDKKSNYIILSYANGAGWCRMDLIDCKEENNKIIIYGEETARGSMSDGSGYLIAIPTNMKVGTTVEFRDCNTREEIGNLQNYGTQRTQLTVDKPIIYLYPTTDIEVSVKLLKEENITCSYPKYTDEWKVLAQPNGNLKDLYTNRQLYSLYYESKSDIEIKIENEGFVIRGEDTATFLEEKLVILGLTEREAEEFIVYWLPKLEANEYNYIRFVTTEEINENMPLEINPKPDTIIRILMTFKGLEKPIKIQEQQLETPNRKGFTVVEWGGSEIK